jgi:hypothetical protein
LGHARVEAPSPQPSPRVREYNDIGKVGHLLHRRDEETARQGD